MRQKLNVITLGVKDLSKSLEFYENTLGWKKSSASQGDLVLFSLGGIVLALYPKKLLADDANVEDTSDAKFSGITFSYNAKNEQEVIDILNKVEKLGAIITKKPQKVFWGGFSGYFQDPDGYLIEVAYNPFWELDENDNVKLP